MGKLRDLFGQEQGVQLPDVIKLIENKLQESSTLEYTTYNKNDDTNNGNIVKSVVGFFNKLDPQSSLLIIGISARDKIPEKMQPVPDGVLSSTRLRQIITDKIGSIPQHKIFPHFDVISVDADQFERGKVFLVEVEPDPRALYYSKFTNSVYVRRGDETKPISLAEAFDIAERRKMAILRVNFKTLKGPDGPMIKPTLINEGVKPARHVKLLLKSGKGVLLKARPPTYRDVTPANPDSPSAYLIAFPEPAYPGLDIELSEISVQISTPDVLDVEIYEEGTVTEQQFNINTDGSLSENTEKFEQGPYGSF